MGTKKKSQRKRSAALPHPIDAIHGQGEALEELGFGTERSHFWFRSIPDDAGPTLEALCDAAHGAEVEFYLPHDQCLGTIADYAENYRAVAVSIVSCCLTTDCFDEEDSRGLYVFSKLKKLRLCVTGRTTYGEDLDNMWLALINLESDLEELVIDLSGSEFSEEKDAEFLKEGIPDSLSDCGFSVEYVWSTPTRSRHKKKLSCR